MGLCVMVVDDSEADLLYSRIVLERSGGGYAVFSCESAREALDHLRESREPLVDLILLDINMPGMNGFQFLDALERLSPPPPRVAVVVMLTSSPDPVDRERALARASVRGYVTKPLTPEAARGLLRHCGG